MLVAAGEGNALAETLVEWEPTTHEPQRRRAVAVIAVLVVALIIAAWLLAAARQRSQVVVWFDARPVECFSGTPDLVNLGDDDEPLFVTAVDASADLDCWLRVRVENRGRLPATLRELVLPGYGPSTGAAIRAGNLSPLALQPAARGREGWPALDATYALRDRLEAGGERTFRIRLEYAPNGCMSPDALMWVQDEPSLTVSALGLRGTRRPLGIGFVQRGTADSSCDSPDPRSARP